MNRTILPSNRGATGWMTTLLLCLIFSLPLHANPAFFFPEIQNITVSGMVVDSDGQAIPGVSVMLKGSSAAVVTDLEDRFIIEVPSPSSILIFSYGAVVTAPVFYLNVFYLNNILHSSYYTILQHYFDAVGVFR